MRLNVRILMVTSLFLIGMINVCIYPSSMRYSEITLAGVSFFRQGEFLTPRATVLSFQERDLINKLVKSCRLDCNTLFSISNKYKGIPIFVESLTDGTIHIVINKNEWVGLSLVQKNTLLEQEIMDYLSIGRLYPANLTTNGINFLRCNKFYMREGLILSKEEKNIIIALIDEFRLPREILIDVGNGYEGVPVIVTMMASGGNDKRIPRVVINKFLWKKLTVKEKSSLLKKELSYYISSGGCLAAIYGDDGEEFVRIGKFLLRTGVELGQEEKLLINRVVDLFQLSYNTIIDLECSDNSVACVKSMPLTNGVEIEHISLSIGWQKLLYQEKEFVLAHEASHWVLGHCKVVEQDWIARICTHLDYKGVILSGGFSFYLAACSACLCFDIYHNRILSKQSKMRRCIVPAGTSIIGVCVYGIMSTYLKRQQIREKEADRKAATMLGSAEGGIAWLNTRNKSDQFSADTLCLSTHPSACARIDNLKKWQADQMISLRR